MPQALDDAVRSLFTRRTLVLALGSTVGLAGVAGGHMLRAALPQSPTPPNVFDEVTPEAGIDTGVRFGGAIPRLIAAGALVPDKLPAPHGGLPGWVRRLFTGTSTETIRFDRERAPYLVNLLWPIGLANRVAFNRSSPINTAKIGGFASTGGWTVGRAANGAAYFNRLAIAPLTERQEFLALAIATNTYRPCCDNSTFFQDCNHGSALLGLIELAAAQGLAADAIYRMALAANSYWFPEQYGRTAQFFTHFAKRSWRQASPPAVMGATFSTLTSWQRNIDTPLRRAGIELPADARMQPICGV